MLNCGNVLLARDVLLGSCFSASPVPKVGNRGGLGPTSGINQLVIVILLGGRGVGYQQRQTKLLLTSKIQHKTWTWDENCCSESYKERGFFKNIISNWSALKQIYFKCKHFKWEFPREQGRELPLAANTTSFHHYLERRSYHLGSFPLHWGGKSGMPMEATARWYLSPWMI